MKELDRYVDFCKKIKPIQFYQPIVLVPGIVELLGKWDKATRDLASFLCCYLENNSVLDLGCNVGFFLFQALRKKASEACGIDNDIHVINIANQIRDLTKSHVTFELATIEEYTPNHHFDVILMMNVLDFVSEPDLQLNRYLNYCDIMIVEHETSHEELLSNHWVFKRGTSQRANGRIVSFLRP